MASLDFLKPVLSKFPFALDVLSRLTLEIKQHQPTAAIALYEGNNKIATYANLEQAPEWLQRRELTDAVGKAVWAAASESGKGRWKRKLVSATENEVSQFWAACEGQASWNSAVESIKRAVPRLVAVHMANALQSVKVPFSQAVRNKDHPCVIEFMAGATGYSLIPLLSAYAPQQIGFVPPTTVCTDGTDFSRFFVEYAYGMNCIGESSVRETCKRVIESVR